MDRQAVKGSKEGDGKMWELPPSEGCFVCGQDNSQGLRITFFTDGEAAYGQYIPSQVYQGYRGVLHGGLLSTLLDEVMVQAFAARGITVVTAKLEVRFRRPVPMAVPLFLKGWVEGERGSSFVAQGQITDGDHGVLTEAKGIFFRAR